jgi:hypothetical protein
MKFGKYCPRKEGECVNFYVQPNGAGAEYGYIFNFTERVPTIASLFEYPRLYNESFLTVTEESYVNFVKNVIDKGTQWNGVVNALSDEGTKKPQTIPGTWSRLSDEEKAAFKKWMDTVGMPRYSAAAARALGNGGPVSPGGSSRKSKRTHRKPTKRRRNRRGNRKTKKN